MSLGMLLKSIEKSTVRQRNYNNNYLIADMMPLIKTINLLIQSSSLNAPLPLLLMVRIFCLISPLPHPRIMKVKSALLSAKLDSKLMKPTPGIMSGAIRSSTI